MRRRERENLEPEEVVYSSCLHTAWEMEAFIWLYDGILEGLHKKITPIMKNQMGNEMER